MSGHPHADLMAKAAEIGIPEPVQELPEDGQLLWVADITTSGSMRLVWTSHESDIRMFKRGILHLTKESAETHIAALLSFTQK